MASLALMVAIIFMAVLLSGPLAMLLIWLNFRNLGAVIAVFAILSGGYWCCFAPFPVSMIGGFSILCGLLAINRY
jgi:hypothetical protein